MRKTNAFLSGRPAMKVAACSLLGLLAMLWAFLLAGCMEGTESGTETGIQGQLSLEGGESASGAEVYAFRTEGLDGAGTAQGDTALLLRILERPDTLEKDSLFRRATADRDGRYRFLGLAAGYHALIGFHEDPLRRGKWVGFLPTLKVEDGGLTEAGTLTLRRMGGITARVSYKGRPAEGVKCHIPGLSFVAYSDEQGRCMLLHVPEGSHALSFEHPDFVTVRRNAVSVESGRITPLEGTVALVRNPDGAPPAPQNPRILLDAAGRIALLAWDSVEVSDLAGYILFRKPSDSLSAVLEIPLHHTLLTGREYRDTLYKSLPDTASITYVYKLLAVDVDGNRSMPAVFSPLHVPAADPVFIAFSRPDFQAREGDGAAVAWIRRAGPALKPVTVKWSLRDSTAVHDSDFVPLSGELLFAPGDSLKAIHAVLADDGHVESQESFLAVLESADNGALLAGPARAILQVKDDDSLTFLSCPASALAVREGDSAVSLAIRREGDKARKAAVKYRVFSGTAKEGEDFAASSGTLTFESGTTLLRIPLRITNDTLEEKPERFTVSLSEPSRDLDLSRCPDMAVDIADDDTNYVASPVDFTQASASHNAWRPDPRAFPGGLYDGDTSAAGLIEFKSTNPDLVPRPEAHWDFRDCGMPLIPDRSGNGHDGNAASATLDCRSDADGKWARFSGEDSVVAASHPGFDFRQAVTVAAWAKADSLVGRHTLVARMYAPTSFALELVDSLWVFTTVIEDGTPEGASHHLNSPAQASGEWTHVAGTYDGKFQRLYVNGEMVAEQTLQGRIQSTGRNVVIGNHPVWSPWHGGIREVKIWGTGLNGWQVWEQMRLETFPPKPLSLTFAFPQPRKVMGAGVAAGSSLGTSRYRWTLAGADAVQDLDLKSGSYAVIGTASDQATDRWSRLSFKVREFKVFRFTLVGTAGTGMLQVNEVSLTGAERVKLP